MRITLELTSRELEQLLIGVDELKSTYQTLQRKALILESQEDNIMFEEAATEIDALKEKLLNQIRPQVVPKEQE